MGKRKDKVKKSDLLKDAIKDLDTSIHNELDERFEEYDKVVQDEYMKELGERFDGVGRQVDEQGDKIADLQQTILAQAQLLGDVRSRLAKVEEREAIGLKVFGELVALRQEVAGVKAQEQQNAKDICRIGDTLTLHTQEAEWEQYFPREGQADSAAALAMVNAFEEKFPHLIRRLRDMDRADDPDNKLNKNAEVPLIPRFDPELEALLEEEAEIDKRKHLDLASQTRDMLLLIGINLSVELLKERFRHNLNEALAWAAQQHLTASDGELAQEPLKKPAWLNEVEHEMAAQRSFQEAQMARHPSNRPRLSVVDPAPIPVWGVTEASLVDDAWPQNTEGSRD